jgi:hypothetical protein
MENNPSPTTQESASSLAPQLSVVTKKPSLKLPIILMVWPVAGLIAVIFLYSIVNFLFSGVTSSDPEHLFNSSGDTVRVIINSILFIIGAAAVVCGPFSFIGGLVLLIVRLQSKDHAQN